MIAHPWKWDASVIHCTPRCGMSSGAQMTRIPPGCVAIDLIAGRLPLRRKGCQPNTTKQSSEWSVAPTSRPSPTNSRPGSRPVLVVARQVAACVWLRPRHHGESRYVSPATVRTRGDGREWPARAQKAILPRSARSVENRVGYAEPRGLPCSDAGHTAARETRYRMPYLLRATWRGHARRPGRVAGSRP
jgi:hypothetical protein